MTLELTLSLVLALLAAIGLLHQAHTRARQHPLARLNRDLREARERRRR